MTSRTQLKDHAKSVLKPNYWKIVLVSFIFLLISGGSTNAVNTGREMMNEVSVSLPSNSVHIQINGQDVLEDFFINDESLLPYSTPREFIYSVRHMMDRLFSGVTGVLLAVVLLIVSLLAIFIDALLLYPLRVGIHRFFLVSQHFPAKLRELSYAFDTNYWNSVKTMLFMRIKLFLWTLLLVIPGIVKSYEYRLIPYLLAEHPDMPSSQVFAASRHLMSGNKWRAFVLDLSFILWNLLSTLTMGIVGILYVNPYRNLTNAAFYEAVCREKQR